MAEYQPVSRRPIASLFRQTANGAVQACVRAGVHPDVISYLSIAASAAAAACFWQARSAPVLLLVAPLLCHVRLWFNMLDGMVAMASKKASLRGEILNDLPDRISDIIIFAGVAHGGLAHPMAGYWAAIFALLTAYVGTFGQALGVGRQFGGMMSKPWRMVALHLGAWVALTLLWSSGRTDLGPLTILDWTCVVVVLGCIQTIWVRLAAILRGLRLKNP